MMAKGLVKDSTLTAIANAIREKTETTATMLPSEMAALISGITGAKMTYGVQTLAVTPPAGSITITHDLGAIPNMIYVCHVSNNITTNKLMLSFILWPDGTGCASATDIDYKTYKREITNDTISDYITDLTETSMTIEVPKDLYFAYLKAGYYWLAGVV